MKKLSKLVICSILLSSCSDEINISPTVVSTEKVERVTKVKDSEVTTNQILEKK